MLRKVAFLNGGGLKLGKKLVRMWWYLLNSLYTTSSVVRMLSLAVFHLLVNNCTTKIYCVLLANKCEREMWSSAFRLG